MRGGQSQVDPHLEGGGKERRFEAASTPTFLQPSHRHLASLACPTEWEDVCGDPNQASIVDPHLVAKSLVRKVICSLRPDGAQWCVALIDWMGIITSAFLQFAAELTGTILGRVEHGYLDLQLGCGQ